MTRLADLPPFCLECPRHLTYGLDLGLGGLSPGHRVIARGICLSADSLTLHSTVFPATPAAGGCASVYAECLFDADISPPDGNYTGGRVRPTAESWSARVIIAAAGGCAVRMVRLFATGHDIDLPVDRHGSPDGDYLAHRVSRLTFDLVTGRVELAPRLGAA